MKSQNHPNRGALSFCHSCGNHFCSECLVEGGDCYYYGPDVACQTKRRRLTRTARKPTRLPDLADGMHGAGYFDGGDWF
jgi:hypothetical protein